MMGRRVVGCSLVASLAACGGTGTSTGNDGPVTMLTGGASGVGGAGGKGGKGGATAGGNGGTGFGVGAGGGAGGSTPVSSITIDPPSATIVVANGMSKPVTFKALGPNGSPVGASWSFDRPDLALVTPGGGVLKANDQNGGTGTLTATVGTAKATAIVNVQVGVVQNPAGLSPGDQAKLDAPGGGSSGTLLYPYDKTMFARGIVAPDLMWSGGGAGDAYLVHLHEAGYDAKLYVKADPPSAVTIPDDVWAALTASNAGEDVTVDVVRLAGGMALAPMHSTWKIAQGSLRGTIYYWAVNQGQLMRIGPGAKSPSLVFDSGASTDPGTPAPIGYTPTSPPWQDNGAGKKCVACHTVSKDGSTLASVFSRSMPGSTGPWGAVDLATSKVTRVGEWTQDVDFEALTPDGKKLVANTTDMKLHLVDVASGAPLASGLDAFTDKVADPAFSPDGKLLAFSGNAIGGYPVEFSSSSLDVIAFDGAGFGARQTIVPAAGKALAFPSFSPDSQWLVYQKGDYSRAKYTNAAMQNVHGNDDLYVVDVAKKVGEVALDRANGVGYLDAKNQHLTYQPTVNPIAVGGYFWVVFVSPRDYGNKMVAKSDPTYENRKQLWVAAVDASPKPGVDPSHPAFLLKGQDLTTTNMSGYWTLEPCKSIGNTCNEGFECCTGFCRADANGKPTCVDPPVNTCAQTGEKCAAGGDCCGAAGGIECVGGFCTMKAPG